MPRTKRPVADRDSAVAYVRVSTDGQAESGLGLAAQRSAITTEVARRGWRLVETFADEGASGKSLDGRPGLQQALQAVRSGAAATLVVSKLDRLSRSVFDFAGLAEQARAEGWSIVVVDLGIDLRSPHGKLTATLLSGISEWERDIISIRTKEALAATRAAGTRLGRPPQLPQAVVDRIVGEREAGQSMPAIARGLDSDGVPTARGGATWSVSTIDRVLRSAGVATGVAAVRADRALCSALPTQ